MADPNIPDIPNEEAQPNEASNIDEMYEEIMGSRSSIEQNFFKNLKMTMPELPSTTSHPPEFAGVESNHNPSAYEEAILTISGVRDDFVDKFSQVADNSEISQFFTECISKLEQAIETLGGNVEPFNPLAHISGLGNAETPAANEVMLLENAQRVVGNTTKNYKLFPATAMAQNYKGRPSVIMQIAVGKDENLKKVNVRVVPKPNVDFAGNEAIDYVRRDDADMVSIRSFHLGHWRDVTSNFEVVWQEEGSAAIRRRS